MDSCYSSREFQQFLKFYQVHHTTSSPHHPQINGFTEALVGISKKLMEKSIKDGETVELWTDAVSHNTHFQHHPISFLKPLQAGN